MPLWSIFGFEYSSIQKKHAKLVHLFGEHELLFAENYLPSALGGCIVVHEDTDWIFGKEVYEPQNPEIGKKEHAFYGIEDTNTHLMAYNPTENTQVMYLTTEWNALDKNKKELVEGTSFDGQKWYFCKTFIIVLPPKTQFDICALEKQNPHERSVGFQAGHYIRGQYEPENIIHEQTIEFELTQHPKPFEWEGVIFGFPFADGKPRLCTQSINGQVTHYYADSFHAVDFRADVGTDMVAVADGVIENVKHYETRSGIETSNLWHWNEIKLKTDTGYFVTYGHIKADSAMFKEGDRVKKGDILCESGQSGFSPEPHLHFIVHKVGDKDRNSVYFGFESKNQSENEEKVFFPVAGKWYNEKGFYPKRKFVYV